MSALTAQLSRLQNRSGGAHTAMVDKSRAAALGVRVVPTILFNPHEARNITREQLLELALVGLRSLVALDNRLSRPAAFLFSDAHTRKERSMFTSAESEKVVAPAVQEFLALLAPHILEPAALQVLEYLIRVFDIHEYDALAVLKLILPAHDQGLFVRVLFLLNLQGTGFEFLRANKQNGTVLPRAALVTAAKENPKVLETICDIAQSCLQKNIEHPAALSMFSFVVSSIATTSDNEQTFRAVLPILIDWLPRARSHPDHSAAAQFVLFVWTNESRFSVDIIRVIFSTVCKLCRNVSSSTSLNTIEENNNSNNNKNDETRTLLLDSYRLLAHFFNSQRAIIAATASASTSTGGDTQLQANIVAQIVNLPFNKAALSSFAKVSPWGFSLLLKHCFAADSDSKESAFEYIEQCLESLPLSQTHVQQVLVELAQAFFVVSSSSSSSSSSSISSFCERAVGTLERRFPKFFDLALAELLKVEATVSSATGKQQQASNNNNNEGDIITSFVLKYCTGSKYELVDFSSSSKSSSSESSLKLPLIGALVHPVSGVRRLAATKLNVVSSSSTITNTFVELLPLIEHVLKTETDTAVLKELFGAISKHFDGALNTLQEKEDQQQEELLQEDNAVVSSSSSDKNKNSNNNSTQKLFAVLFEAFRALTRFFPSDEAALSNNNSNGPKASFLRLCSSFADILSSSTSKKPISIAITLFLNQVEESLIVAASSSATVAALKDVLKQARTTLSVASSFTDSSSKSASSSSSSFSFWSELFASSSSSSSMMMNWIESLAIENWNTSISNVINVAASQQQQPQQQQQSNQSSLQPQQKVTAVADAALLQVALYSALTSSASSGMTTSNTSILFNVLRNKVFAFCAAPSNNQNNSKNNQSASASASSTSTLLSSTTIAHRIAESLAAFLLSSLTTTATASTATTMITAEVSSLILTSCSVSKDDSTLHDLFIHSLIMKESASSTFTSVVLSLASGVEFYRMNNNNNTRQFSSSSSSPLLQSVRNATQLFKNLGKLFIKHKNESRIVDENHKLLLSLVMVALLSSLQSSRSSSEGSSSLSGGAGSASHQLHVAFVNAAKELSEGLIDGHILVTNNNKNNNNQQQQLHQYFADVILRRSLQNITGFGEGGVETQQQQNNEDVFEKLLFEIILPNILLSSSSMSTTVDNKIKNKTKNNSNNNNISSLASFAPSLYSKCLDLISSSCPSITASKTSSSSSSSIGVLLAESVAPLLELCDSSASSSSASTSPATGNLLPIKSVVRLAEALGLANSVVPPFFEEKFVSKPIKVEASSSSDQPQVQDDSSSSSLVPKFAAEIVMHLVPGYFVAVVLVSKIDNNSNKTNFVSTLLNLQRRGCNGITTAIARCPSIFKILVEDILLPLTKNTTTASTSSSISLLESVSDCIRFTLQEKTAIESTIVLADENKNDAPIKILSTAALTAAEACIVLASSLITNNNNNNNNNSKKNALSSAKFASSVRSNLLSTASACLDFCINFKTSLESIFFFLSSSSSSSSFGSWAPFVLAPDASTVHGIINLIDSAVTLALSAKDEVVRNKLSSEALNLLASVVVGAFEEKKKSDDKKKNTGNEGDDNNDDVVIITTTVGARYSPTAAVQKLMKSLLPALMKTSTTSSSKFDEIDFNDDNKDAEHDNDESSSDDDEDAPPVIFSRTKPVLNKYSSSSSKKKKQQQDAAAKQKMRKTPEELRAIAQKRRDRILELFDTAKTNLALPIISLLIKMRDVASAAQLQFKSPDSVLTDIVCSFDIIDQMACYRGILEIWFEAMNHPQGICNTTSNSNVDGASNNEITPLQRQMASTDLRPFSYAIASFLRSWVEDSRFIDSFVAANTAAVVDALREQTERGGGGSSLLSLVRTAPTLAPFCDSIFSAMALFQHYKTLSLQNGESQEQQQSDKQAVNEDEDEDEFDNNFNNNNGAKKSRSNNWYVGLLGGVVATMLSMVDEELFVICIREITISKSLLAASHHRHQQQKNNNTIQQQQSTSSYTSSQNAAIIASRRIGLEILCDRLALSTTLGGSSARYTSRSERIARGATAILSEKVAQRILELLHRLMKQLTISVDVPVSQNTKTTENSSTPLSSVSDSFVNTKKKGSLSTTAAAASSNNNNDDKSTKNESGARRDRVEQQGKNNNKNNNKDSDNDNDDEGEETNNNNNNQTSSSSSSYRGLLRRTLLSVPREHILDIQWIIMCCEESARCFGAVKGDQLGLILGTLSRIGLDSVCFRGRVFPTVPTYRGVEFVASCAWKGEENDDDVEDHTNNHNVSSSSSLLPRPIESSQIVLLCSVATASSILASTLGASRMISTSGNDILNLLTTSIRYSARMSHQLLVHHTNHESSSSTTGETREALRQLRSIALDSLRRTLPSTWTLVEPFLPHIISSVTSHSLADDAETSAASRELLGELDSLLEPRVLFPCIAEALNQSYPETHSFTLLFQVVQNLISRLSKTEVKQIPSLMNCELFTVAFDKFAAQKKRLAHIDTLRASFSAFASLIVKFRESTSKSLCSNIVVWATSTRRSSKQSNPRPNEIQRWTLCLGLFEYLIERLGEVSDFVFPVVSPVIVDVLSTLSTTSTAPVSLQQYILKNAAQESTACLDSAFACVRRIADVANEAAEKTNTVTDSPDTPEALLPYFARPAPFEALRDPIASQIGNVTLLADANMDYSTRAQDVIVPSLRALFKSLRNPKLWSQMQQALLKNLRQPSVKARLVVLSLLRVIYADGGDTLASLVLAEALPAIVEATEDMDANVSEEARLLCRELSTITGQDVLEYMSA